jgi:flagellar hook-associated protein 3 FlgL
MTASFISTTSFINSGRANWTQLRSNITQANIEITTGRYADVGLSLGASSGQGLTIRREDATLEALTTDDSKLASSLSQSQAALQNMSSDANAFLQSLVSAPNGSTTPATLQQQASSNLASFIDGANTAAGGRYLFAGINTQNQPMKDYASGGKPAVDAAFQAAFGFNQNDPAVANITATQMTDFLNNQFAALFADPAWGTNWSSASNQNVTQQISPSEKVTASVNANSTAMRQLAMAYTMVADLGTTNLNADARNAVIAKASSVIGSASTNLTTLQVQIGEAQNRVTNASTQMTSNRGLLATQLDSLEGVDPAAAKVRSDSYSNELEMSYSLTTKLLNLSILNYVPVA